MQKNISSTVLKKMIIVGAKALENNRELVDSLNVFPVPDGDTGTNMSLTIQSAVRELNNWYDNTWTSFADALSRGALKGARGNSGVILSQILKGMAMEFAKAEHAVDVKIFAKALTMGSAIAYKAVTKPREGTILTVIRIMAESGEKAAKKVNTLEEFLELVLADGEKVLQQTPDMLPVLKKAGVVDAGGRGLLVVFAGMQQALVGADSEDVDVDVDKMDNKGTATGDSYDKLSQEHDHLADIEHLGDIEFGYCTEFMVTHMKKKTTESDIDKLREKLVALGDSVVCVGDLELVKVHVHTNEPNVAFGYGLELGELINLKVDNMREQNRELKRKRKEEEQNQKEYGMIAVAPGDGIAAVFKDILVDLVVQGGQTMNPSAEDIANACDKVPAKKVFVLPNNKNIIMAAEQANDISKKEVIVIPTKSVPEGVASALAFNAEVTEKENIDAMVTAKQTVTSASVTYAVRDTKIDGFDLKKQDIIGLDAHKIVTQAKTVDEATLKLVETLKQDEVYNITLFYGADVTEKQAENLREKLEKQYPDCDIIMISGDQPVYYYIISME